MLPRVCIPSYKRHKIIQEKTLRFLETQLYPAERIIIFVASVEEEKIYKESIPHSLYGEIRVGVLGLSNQRNFITDFLDEGEIYISMDDDVKGIKLMTGNFLDLVKDATSESCLGNGLSGLYGVHPNDDARRFKERTTTHLTHILGSFFICRNHRDIRITHTHKEDYERSILYFLRYGTVLRCGRGGVSTSYMQTPGGLQTESGGRAEGENKAVQHLVERYPGLCKRKDMKGFPDLVLNWRAKV